LENLHVSGEITIAWETVRQRIKISVKEMLRHVNKMILNHIFWIFFRICRSINRTKLCWL